jgi:hypothetical protein
MLTHDTTTFAGPVFLTPRLIARLHLPLWSLVVTAKTPRNINDL